MAATAVIAHKEVCEGLQSSEIQTAEKQNFHL